MNNKYIESDIQKGFWTGVSGTIEHMELLTHIIRMPKKQKKRTSRHPFDLKNVFGEVNHNLIQKVLVYHQIPLHVSG